MHHYEFLRIHLNSNHPLFLKPLFQVSRLHERLKIFVECRGPKPNDHINPTGIPPDISLLNDFHIVANKLDRLIPEVNNIAANTGIDY